MKTNLRRTAIAAAICILLFLSVPLSLIGVGFGLPAQYTETYYAVLPKMYKRLKQTEGKRIIIVGNSAAAFGLSAGVIESEIQGYTVCPFGLYGAIGTKAMMDISRSNIHEGDIVILAPEQTAQSQSLYFNGFYMWNAADGDTEILGQLDWDNSGVMAGSFPAYASRKFNYFVNGDAPVPDDVYAASSFDENCYMTYDRPYNRMVGGFDANDSVSFEKEVFSDSFGDYVNEYNKLVLSKGATLLYGFVPVNVDGIAPGTDENKIVAFYDAVQEKLDCPFIGNPLNYIMDSDWFYDSNVHMNSAGAVVYTRQLVCDLKAYLSDSTPVKTEIPEKPEVPQEDVTGQDGKDAALFEYVAKGNGWEITALKPEGKNREEIEIPDFYEGKKVLSFTNTVFNGNTDIITIRLGKYITGIADDSFIGCPNLKKLYVHPECKPADCHVYWSLLSGAPDCKIYVPHAKYNDYINDYFWSKYGAYIREC